MLLNICFCSNNCALDHSRLWYELPVLFKESLMFRYKVHSSSTLLFDESWWLSWVQSFANMKLTCLDV